MVQTIVFLGGMSAVLLLAHVYVYRRLVRDTTEPGRLRRIGLITLVTVAVLTVVLNVASRALPLPFVVVQVLAWPTYLWMALLFYLFVYLVVLEIPRLLAARALRRRTKEVVEPAPALSEPATVPAEGTATAVLTEAPPEPERPVGPVDPGRRLFLARSVATVAAVAATGTVGYGLSRGLGAPDLLRERSVLRRLDPRLAGFRIAVVSDIHLSAILGRSHAQRVVDMINSTQPDLVAIVGDLVDGTVAELGNAAEPLRGLRATHGSFFVTGNHEYYTETEAWLDKLRELGVRPLLNERVEIAGRGAFDLAGVNDVQADRVGKQGPDFGKALGGRDATRPVVLLAHQPIQVKEASKHGVDLQLSGHTHGGQIQPFGLAVMAQQPAVAGWSRHGDTQLWVTRGAGTFGPPVRVGAPPDITVMELQPGS